MAKIKINWMGKNCLVDIRDIDVNIFLAGLKHRKQESYLLKFEDEHNIWNSFEIEDFFTPTELFSDLYLLLLFGKNNIIDMFGHYHSKKQNYLIDNYDKHVNELIIKQIIE